MRSRASAWKRRCARSHVDLLRGGLEKAKITPTKPRVGLVNIPYLSILTFPFEGEGGFFLTLEGQIEADDHAAGDV